jgi:DNA repair protein RadC
MERTKGQQRAGNCGAQQKAASCQESKHEGLNKIASKKQRMAKRNRDYWDRHLSMMMNAPANTVSERTASIDIPKEDLCILPSSSSFSRPDSIAVKELSTLRTRLVDVRQEDRPREKMLKRGAKSLSDPELIALVLNTGANGMDVLAFAQHLLDQFGGLAGIESLGVEELTRMPGMGLAKATRILAGFELCRRSNLQRRQQQNFNNSSEIASFLRPLISGRAQEVFHVVFMNLANRVIASRDVSSGGISSTIVDPVLIFRTALQLGAVKILVGHNHPSGDLRPSREDLRITHKLFDIGELMGIHLLDHVIIGSDGYFSFLDNGMLNPKSQHMATLIRNLDKVLT